MAKNGSILKLVTYLKGGKSVAQGTPGAVRHESTNWYILYHRDGKQHREATGTADRAEAERFLARRLAYWNTQALTQQPCKPDDLDEPAFITLHGQDLNVFLKPVVYVFFCGSECLYVGSGISLSRPFDRNHHRRAELGCADSLKLYPCDSHKAALALEARMIAELEPTLNKKGSQNGRYDSEGYNVPA